MKTFRIGSLILLFGLGAAPALAQDSFGSAPQPQQQQQRAQASAPAQSQQQQRQNQSPMPNGGQQQGGQGVSMQTPGPNDHHPGEWADGYGYSVQQQVGGASRGLRIVRM